MKRTRTRSANLLLRTLAPLIQVSLLAMLSFSVPSALPQTARPDAVSQQIQDGAPDPIEVASQEAVLSAGTANYPNALNHLNHTLANHFLIGPTQACWAIARYTNKFPNLRLHADTVLADAGIPYVLAEGNTAGTVGCRPGRASAATSQVATGGQRHPCNNPDIPTATDTTSYRAHVYEVSSIICATSDSRCTVDAIYKLMLSRRSFVAPTVDKTPLTLCATTLLHLDPRGVGAPTWSMYAASPLIGAVLSAGLMDGWIETDLNSRAHSITNYTLPGHPLYPGLITRSVALDPSKRFVIVYTYGQGSGHWAPVNVCMSNFLWNRVVNGRMVRAFNAQSGSTVDPTEGEGSPTEWSSLDQCAANIKGLPSIFGRH